MRRLSVIFCLFLLSCSNPGPQNKYKCAPNGDSEVHQLQLPFLQINNRLTANNFDHAALQESVRIDAAGIELWQVVSPDTDSLISIVSGKDQLLQLTGFVKSDRWTKASIKHINDSIFELYSMAIR